MAVGEPCEIRDHLLEIGAAASSPPATANDFAEPNHSSRIQADEAAESKDSNSQSAELDATGRDAALRRL